MLRGGVMAIKTSAVQDLDLSASVDVVFEVFNVSEVTVYLDYLSETGAALSTAVVTIERSPDGKVWYAMQSATTLSSEAATADLDVSNANYIRARTSTVQADAGEARIHVVGLVSADQ